ncbi:MAG TPA: type II secretion system F family protein [Gemmataceae bacterium]|nr:type II secretion system F family protein [Gemmataceae bacterium]
MIDWIILGCIFLVVVGITLAIVRIATGSGRRIDDRLAQAQAQPEYDDRLLLGELTEPLATLTSPRDDKREALTQELREAGYYRSTALMEYAALRAMLVGFPIIVSVLLAVLVDVSMVPTVIIAGLVVAVLGYSVPRLYVNYRARERSGQIERGLPVAVDLLSLCLTGGQNLLGALGRVSRDLETSYPVLAQELRIVHKHAEMVGLEMALRHFAARTGVQEAKNLSVILTHSERLGSDIATSLLEFAGSFRQTLRQRAEAQANRASFWMLFPTILCLLLPALVLFNAPLVYEFGRAKRQINADSRKDLKALKTDEEVSAKQ